MATPLGSRSRDRNQQRGIRTMTAKYGDKRAVAAGIRAASGEAQKRLMAESAGMTYLAPRRINLAGEGDYGADPLGDGTFRMVPSGEIVDFAERCRRLEKRGA
jgi:hypothetical protein